MEKVLILTGSDSDIHVMEKAAEVLDEFGVAYRLTIASAHRTPDYVKRLVSGAEKKGAEVIIAGAGMAAHLAGVIASHTTLPVIGVPIEASGLGGLDALLSTVQMPGGVPVAAMAIGKAGAKNAGLFAVQILAIKDAGLRKKLQAYKARMAASVRKKAAKFEAERKKGKK